MIIISRAAWGARSPTSITPLNKSRVVNFIVHYSGANRNQTIRSLQNFCMDTKGHSDIDYNRIVRDDLAYTGRDWNVGSHTLGNNSTGYGVCVMGVDGDATDADRRTVREIYEEVCATLGRRITMTDHRNLLGSSYTSCPGDELDTWVDSGMPYPSGGDVATIDQEDWDNLRWRQYSVEVEGSNTALGGPAVGQQMWQPKFLKAMDAKLNQLIAMSPGSPGSTDPELIRRIVREELDRTRLTGDDVG